MTPYPGEVAEARNYPGGYVYRIAGNHAPTGGVPPEAIVQAMNVPNLRQDHLRSVITRAASGSLREFDDIVRALRAGE